MTGSKATLWLIATMMFLSMGAVVYPQGSANAADTYCAKAVGANEAPDCSFSNIQDCRTSLKAKGGGRCYKQ
jgi:hypothetical protein